MNKQMNNIEKLTAALCPEGVEFRALQELFITRNGYTPSTTNKAYWTDGTIPWFRMEDIRENGRILGGSLQQINAEAIKGGRLFPANSIIVATSATIGEHALITVPHLSNQRFTSLALKPEFADRLQMKFIFYYCFVLCEWCRKNTTTSSFASVDMNGFKKLPIPIPPLAVQQEIVKILDTFTTLEAELEAELEARKKQYEYYRNELLTFGDDVEWKSLGSACNIFTGGETPENSIKGEEPTETYKYPIFGNGAEIYGYTDTYRIDKDAVTISSIGANTGTIYFRKAFFTPIIRLKVVLPIKEELLLSKYLFHYLSSIKIYSKKSSVPNMNANDVKAIKIPIPSLAEQERIVAILDKFDALVNGTTPALRATPPEEGNIPALTGTFPQEGNMTALTDSSPDEGNLFASLPAELNARRKQYEYYRNKLLTFKEFNSPPLEGCQSKTDGVVS